MKKNILQVEKDVLRNYQKSNPSFIKLNKNSFKNHKSRRKSLFQYKLNFPIKLFKNSHVLDLGSGTGEQDLCYASWGADLTLVEINSVSVQQTKKYFTDFNYASKIKEIHNCSIFDFKPKKSYDIVISEGVFHHTENPKKCFDILIENLKDDGFVILQLAFDSSLLQRSLQRMIMNYLTDGDYDKIITYSPKLFSETLERASKFGGRSFKQIIHDFYTNPKHKGIGYLEIMNWFKDNNIKFYSAYPSINPENLINGVHLKGGAELLNEYPHISAFANIYFIMASSEDQDFIGDFYENAIYTNKKMQSLMDESGLNDYVYGTQRDIKHLTESFKDYFSSVHNLFKVRNEIVMHKIRKFEEELLLLLSNLNKMDINKIQKSINSFEVLFRGFNGVPSNYIIGCKSSKNEF